MNTGKITTHPFFYFLYRLLVWRYLLKLPENKESYDPLVRKGLHPSYKDFRKKFSMKSEKLIKSMER